MEFKILLFLKTKEKGNELLHLGPGGEGKVGEKGEGARAHLPVVSVGAEVACGGLSAGAGGRWRPCTAATAPRRGGGGLARLGSSVEAR